MLSKRITAYVDPPFGPAKSDDPFFLNELVQHVDGHVSAHTIVKNDLYFPVVTSVSHSATPSSGLHIGENRGPQIRMIHR